MNTNTKVKVNFIGRKEEINILQQLYTSNKAEFLALYGRRRVGKTLLIRHFFQNKPGFFFNVTGTKDGSLSEQITHFKEQISRTFYNGITLAMPQSWDEAFRLLTVSIERLKTKKIILFFDEIPWLVTKKSGFLQSLDYYWNQHWSNDGRIKLIICGSSASWIINKVLNNRGGLHNRITQRICLQPFNLQETRSYLYSSGLSLKDQQILLLYMVTGGVAYYLANIKRGMSAAQIVENLAFSEKGVLFNEFNNLFSALFDNADLYIQLVQIIGKHQYGIGKRELLKSLGKAFMGSGGLKKLEELEEAGFIISLRPIYHKRQGIYYRLIDEYVLFYLRWIESLKSTLQKKSLVKGGWQNIQQTPAWYNWLGYAFETVCYKHISVIKKSLSIPPDALASSWRYVPRKGEPTRGAQIDLLFDRNDDAITICEIKYTEQPFVFTKEYVLTLKQKLQVFKEQTKTKKQLFLAIISANGIKNNFYAEDLISGVVTLENFFEL
jgi:hypothetical protein